MLQLSQLVALLYFQTDVHRLVVSYIPIPIPIPISTLCATRITPLSLLNSAINVVLQGILDQEDMHNHPDI